MNNTVDLIHFIDFVLILILSYVSSSSEALPPQINFSLWHMFILIANTVCNTKEVCDKSGKL